MAGARESDGSRRDSDELKCAPRVSVRETSG